MKRLLIPFLCCALLLVSCGKAVDTSETEAVPDAETEAVPGDSAAAAGVSLEGIDAGMTVISTLYDAGFDSVDELLEGAPLIVRAVPVSVESESGAALCWVLRVEEANRDVPETVRLRQIKDSYTLTAGEEAVLALEEDDGEGYYHIAGGGCGLFRLDGNGAVTGVLADSLAEMAGASRSAAPATLEEVFDLLAAASEK